MKIGIIILVNTIIAAHVEEHLTRKKQSDKKS